MASVKLEGVTKRFGSIVAIDDLDVQIENGEVLCLLGPTGAGKTTTLNVVAGLERPESGKVLIDGALANEVNPAGRDVAFVFQYYSLYPNYTVRQNLEFPLKAPVRRMGAKDMQNKWKRSAWSADLPPVGEEGRQAERRRDAACLDRTGNREESQGVPDGRTAGATSTPNLGKR